MNNVKGKAMVIWLTLSIDFKEGPSTSANGTSTFDAEPHRNDPALIDGLSGYRSFPRIKGVAQAFAHEVQHRQGSRKERATGRARATRPMVKYLCAWLSSSPQLGVGAASPKPR